MNRYGLIIGAVAAWVVQATWAQAADMQWHTAHAVSLFNAPVYNAQYKKFHYAPPPASPNGVLRIAHLGAFDNLNPFNSKGTAAPGLGMLFVTLMTPAADDNYSAYGMVAHTVRYNDDKTIVEFDLYPEARLHNNTPLRASDVVFTFNLLRDKGSPSYKFYYADVLKAEAISPHTVRFYAKTAHNRELPLILGQLPVLSQAEWQNVSFDSAWRTPPVGSGAYALTQLINNRTVVYDRVPNAPLQNIPSQVGRNQLAQIRYESYFDQQSAFEAFKAGDVDVWIESSAKNWANNFDFAAIKNGSIVKTVLPTQGPYGMQGFVLNMRRPMFANREVRRAIGMALDFNSLNRTLFYGQYTRTSSFFEASPLAATQLPSPAELKLLEPWRAELPPEVFTQVYTAPSGDNRAQLLAATDILQRAGYTIDKAGILRDAQQQPLEFSFLVADPRFERIVLPIIDNLRRLGIIATMRVIDGAQYTKRVEAFDYDVIIDTFGQSASPGNEQRDMWSSASATQKGSQNTIGLQSKAIDSLVDSIIFARTYEELQTACRALDRVLQWGFYVIPQWHFAGVRMAYKKGFTFPDPKTMPFGGSLPDWWRVAAP